VKKSPPGWNILGGFFYKTPGHWEGKPRGGREGNPGRRGGKPRGVGKETPGRWEGKPRGVAPDPTRG